MGWQVQQLPSSSFQGPVQASADGFECATDRSRQVMYSQGIALGLGWDCTTASRSLPEGVQADCMPEMQDCAPKSASETLSNALGHLLRADGGRDGRVQHLGESCSQPMGRQPLLGQSIAQVSNSPPHRINAHLLLPQTWQIRERADMSDAFAEASLFNR